MQRSEPVSIWLAPGVPESVRSAVGRTSLVQTADGRADVVVVAATEPAPALRADGPALIVLGDARTAPPHWLEVDVDCFSTPAAFSRAPERLVDRALAARRALRIGPTGGERSWLDAVRTVTGADEVARVFTDEIEWSGDSTDLARLLAPVAQAARSGPVVVPSRAALRERFGVEDPRVDGLVAFPLGTRAADGVLLALVRAGGADWVADAVPAARAIANAAHREGLVRRLVAAESGRRWLEKLMQRILSVVSHDLRNSLFAVQLGVKVLEREHGANEQISKIHRTIGNATQLLRKLVDAGRQVLEAPPGPTPGAAADLGEVAERAAAAAARAVPGDREIVLPQAAGDRVAVDPLTLERVLLTLFENALLHAGAGPISVAVHDDGSSVRLEVRNPGRLPFVDSDRLDPFEHRANGGLGVGLYTARRLCEALGLALRVRQHEDEVVATLTMPRAPAARPEQPIGAGAS